MIPRCTAVDYRCDLRQRGAGGCDRGFWLEQAHAEQPAVLIDALYDVSVQLELRDDGGWERDPGGMQRGERERLVAGLAAAALAAAVAERQWASSTDCRASGPERDYERVEAFLSWTGREAAAPAPVGRSLGAAVDERPGPAADVAACS